jgi:hypothetical protein
MPIIGNPFNQFPVAGGAYSPADEGNLALWLDGLVGAAAAQWDDQSGNNNHATQATGGNQASVAGGGYTFDGTDDWYQLASGITVPDDGFTVYAVIDRAGGATDRALCSGTASAAAMCFVDDNHRLHVNRSQTTDAGHSGTALTDAKKVATWVFTINLREFFENTTALSTNSTTVGSFGAINRIGADWNGAAHTAFFNGVMYEVLMFPDAHDSTVRGRVVDYLMTKHSL